MTSQLRILLIEDDDAFAILVRRILKKLDPNHVVDHVVRLSEGRDLLRSQAFDLVLTDLTLPDAAGLDAVEQVRSETPDIPVIVLTLLESTDLISAALKTGAQDFIVKDTITPPLLERSIQNAVERQKMVAENAHLIKRLKQQQRRLNEKNDRLEHLLETTQRFVDNVSHEFRTPLTVIREYASLMHEGVVGETTEQQDVFLSSIVCRVDDLNRMVDDMLDSSKLEAGIMGIHHAPAAAADIIAAPLHGLQLKAMARGIALTSELPEDLPGVFCDAEKAGRVVTNLVANALKFTRDNIGRVHVSARHLRDQGDIEFCIADNGPGISTQQQNLLFERFQQLGTSTVSSTKGFGLGLNIARELVELNYGQIRFESESGAGTSFFFTVPANNWTELVRRYCVRLQKDDRLSSILIVRIRSTSPITKAELGSINAYWRFTQRQTDLVHQTDDAEWKLLAACDRDQVDLIVKRLRSSHAQVSRSRPDSLVALDFEPLGCFEPNDIQAILEVADDRLACGI